MKYIDAEKLIAEIEKRAKFHDDAMKACVGLNNIAITHSAGWKEDTELLAIIDYLQQEQPVLPDNIDKAAKEYDEAESWRYEALPYPRRAAFIEGAEWMAGQMKQEQQDVDLEKDEMIETTLSLFYEEKGFIGGFNAALEIAKYFYNLGLKARK